MNWQILGFISDIVLAVTAIIGVRISLATWHDNVKKTKRALIKDLIQETLEDSEISEVFRNIDYNKHWYDEKFHDSPLERKVDKAFMRFSYFIDLLEDEYIDNKALDLIKYHLQRVLHNHDSQTYLFNLLNFTQKIEATFPYATLVKYGKENGYLDETFFNPELGLKEYDKFLNW